MSHGGDIYSNTIQYDFSVNLNPLGPPESIKEHFFELYQGVSQYPEKDSKELRKLLSGKLQMDEDNIVIGNGASELILELIRIKRADNVFAFEPAFTGYAYACSATGSNYKPIITTKDNDFAITHIEVTKLKEEILKNQNSKNLVIICNPNNPTGYYFDKALMEEVLEFCDLQGVSVIIDECFMKLSDEENHNSILNLLTCDKNRYKNVYVIRAFTKSYALSGVRLGYVVSNNTSQLYKLSNTLPEWNVSTLAQKMGALALCKTDSDYFGNAKKIIKEERKYITDSLIKLGFKVYSSRSNYILFEDINRLTGCEVSLKDMLIAKGILIRECNDYVCLEGSFYRVAVKNHDDNVKLIMAIEGVLEDLK